jgi:predicted MFS family arabinose efflux permease
MTDTKALSPMPPAEKRLLYILGGIQLTHIVDFMVMMPLGPMLTRDLGVTTDQFGVLVSSYTFAAAIAGLLCALFVDRFERKRLLLTLYALFALATLACAFAPSYGGLLAARALAGAFGGVLGALVSTVIGDQIPPERRGRAGGYVSASFALSTVAGVPLALWLANHTPLLHWRAPFVLVAILSVGFGLAAWKWLAVKPPSQMEPQAAATLTSQPDAPQGLWLSAWQRITGVLADPIHRWSILFGCLVMFSSFSIIPFITIFAVGTVKFPESMLPLMYLIGGIATLVTSRWVGKFTDREGKHKSFLIFAPLAAIPMLVSTHMIPVPVWVYLVVSTMFFVLVSARMIPTMALMNGSADPKLRGTFMSLSASFTQAAMGLGAFVTGHIVSVDAGGVMTGYNYAGYIALLATMAAVWVSTRLKQRG